MTTKRTRAKGPQKPPLPEGLDPALAVFANFLWLTWQHLGLPPPTRLQMDVANWMQYGPRHLCVQAFRGFGKSWIASSFGVWRLLLDPNRKFLQVSAAKKRSDDATRFMLALVTGMPVLQHLIPTEEQRSSSVEFDVAGCAPAHAPSCRSIGALSSLLTGSRTEDFCVDDAETRKNSITVLMRDRMLDAFREIDGAIQRSVDEVYDPRGIVLGTPQIEDSLYHQMPSRGYAVRIYPARYPTEEQQRIYGDRLAPCLAEDLEKRPELRGAPTEPTRFGDAELVARQGKYGMHGWLLQFMLMPSLGTEERYPLKLRNCIAMDLDADVAPEKVLWSNAPEYKVKDLPRLGFRGDSWFRPSGILGEKYQPYTRKALAIDPSGRGQDELGWCVGGVLNSQIFLQDAGGFLGGYDESTLTTLARKASQWGVHDVIYEDNFGDGMWGKLFEPILRRHAPDCRLESVHHHTQKEKRLLDTVDPPVASHRLVVNRSVIIDDHQSIKGYDTEQSATYSLFHQFTRLTEDKGCLAHDDRLEALSILVAHFADLMGRDHADEMRMRQMESWDQELADFEESVLGRKRHQPSWIRL